MKSNCMVAVYVVCATVCICQLEISVYVLFKFANVDVMMIR